VCWNNELSETFIVNRGVRQGSPLSPFLFAIVLDDVIDVINDLNVGCEIKGRKVNIIIYADDIVLLGPTKMSVEIMLKKLISELSKKGLEVNKQKTVAIKFKRGKKEIDQSKVKVAGGEVEWVSEIKYLGFFLQSDFNWDKQVKENMAKMNKMGNMVLQQVGTIVAEKDRVYLLQCCAFDLYGIEFCNNISRKLTVNFAKSYHWLVKRSLGLSKFYGNHMACVESGLLTWELLKAWKELILWEKILNSENEIMGLLFDDKRWDTLLGKRVFKTIMDFGKDAEGAKEIKLNMMTFIEGVAILKEIEKDNLDI